MEHQKVVFQSVEEVRLTTGVELRPLSELSKSEYGKIHRRMSVYKVMTEYRYKNEKGKVYYDISEAENWIDKPRGRHKLSDYKKEGDE